MDRQVFRVALLCFLLAVALSVGAAAADKSGDGFTRLALNGATAYASYRCGASAQIFVAVYAEDSGKMCALGVKEASAGAGDATIPLDGDIPEHFTAKAFLLDSALAPLCAACPIPFEAEPEPEDDTAVLRGATNFYANACIDNGVLYYTFLPEPKIYAYNGSDTVSFASGGRTVNLIVRGDTLYYLNYDNKSIYTIDLDTGKRSILYNREEVDDFVIRGNELFIDTPETLSVMDLTTKQVRKIHEYESRGAGDSIYLNTYFINTVSANRFYVGRNRTLYGKERVLLLALKEEREVETKTRKARLTATLLDPVSGNTKEIWSEEWEAIYRVMTANSYGYLISSPIFPSDSSGYQCFEAGDDIYLRLYVFSMEEGGEIEHSYVYYKINLASETATECAEAEYVAASGQWAFPIRTSSDAVKQIEGINPLTGAQETLMRSANYLLPVAQTSGKEILFEFGNPKERGTSTMARLDWFSSAHLYMTDIDGNNPVELASYSSATGTESGTGQAFIESSGIGTRTCHICNGAGSVECLYCHGSGVGWHTTLGVGGGSSYGPCPSCGGTGKNICKICWGAGVIVT